MREEDETEGVTGSEEVAGFAISAVAEEAVTVARVAVDVRVLERNRMGGGGDRHVLPRLVRNESGCPICDSFCAASEDLCDDEDDDVGGVGYCACSWIAGIFAEKARRARGSEAWTGTAA